MSDVSGWLNGDMVAGELNEIADPKSEGSARAAAAALNVRVAMHNGVKERLLARQLAAESVAASDRVATETKALSKATNALVAVTVVLVVAAIVSAVLAGIAISHDKQPIVVRVCQVGTSVTKC